MCLTGIHGQIYMAWTGKKKRRHRRAIKNQMLKGELEGEVEGACSYSLEVAYAVSTQSFVLF